jgi:glycosyltransferase involved in cell wall biosynthesis
VHGVEEGGFIAALLGRRFGARVIYDMQSSIPDELRRHRLLGARPMQRLLRACERWLVGAVDVVACSGGLGARVRALAPGAAVREWSYPVFGAVPDRSAVDALRSELGIAGGAPVIVYTGTFEPYQGLPEIVDAIPRVSAALPDSVFVLVGADEAGGRRVARQAAALGLNGSLRIVPRRPIEEIGLYHALGDVLLAPRALGDNLPLKLFHYMAAGRPIVATGIDNESAIAGAGCARVVDHSSRAIADAVLALLGDTESAAALAARATTFANERLNGGTFEGAVREMYGTRPVPEAG